MTLGSLTVAIASSIALGGVIAVSAWTINERLVDRRDIQLVLDLALAYRDHMSASRCALPNTPLTLSAVRTTIAGAGQSHAVVEDEGSWRISFDGDANRQAAVTVFKVDSTSNIVRSRTFNLPIAGGDRTHEFFDAVFASRVCP